GDAVAEHGGAVQVVEAAQLGAQAGAVEDVVAQDEGAPVAGDVVGADEEGLGQPAGGGLGGVAQGDAEPGPVAQEAGELVGVVGGGDDEDVADAGQHQGGQRVVDHRLVVDRDELFGHRLGDRVQPG